SKAKTKQEEVLEFLDNLDNFTPESSDEPSGVTPQRDASDVLAFIDEITQKSTEPTRTTIDRPASRAGTPGSLRKSTERVKVGGPGRQASSASLRAQAASPNEPVPPPAPASTSALAGVAGGWGWSSMWSTASSALQQARNVVDEQVKHLPRQEQAMKWREGMIEYAKNAQLDKLGEDFKRVGLSTLTDILNVVAPPISEHEVIKVWLSHDMQGFDGIESLVYSSLARIMEQVQGGDLIVNKGNETKPKDSDVASKRDMQAVEGFEPAIKLAQANIEDLIKTNKAPESILPPSSLQNPTTTSYVYLRLQPFTSSFTLPTSPSTPAPVIQSNLQFLVHLVDPAHQLAHTTVTQAIPGKWLDVWDEYDWVEDLVAEALRVGVEVVGQEYIVARMGW
ncbi:maintenance of telomere capping protein 1, partial [Vararia minispora EC-137]